MTKEKRNVKAQQARKATYRVGNWAAYNKGLVQRGSITLWISEEVLANWHPEPEGKRRRGGQVQYSDQAVECLLMLKAVYHLPYLKRWGLVSR